MSCRGILPPKPPLFSTLLAAGEPEQVNAAGYLAGGTAFEPFLSRNLTPCQDGKPAGLSLAEFLEVMHTGVDLKDTLLPPGKTLVLQVLP